MAKIKKCKNCKRKTKNGNKYCSFKCRNIYVNKYLRDYTKNGAYFSKEKYYKPKKCRCCKKKLPYDKRSNIFCSSVCAGRYNSPGRNLSQKHKKKISRSVSKTHKRKFKLKEIIGKCKCCNKSIRRKDLKHKQFKSKKFCSKKCRREFLRRNMTEFSIYKQDCIFRFSISKYPNEFDSKLIKKYGWYKPKNKGNNMGGVSRDHIFSLKQGFKLGISTKIISHPANCQLLVHNDNVSKYTKCDISIKELRKKIKAWDKKYGKKIIGT